MRTRRKGILKWWWIPAFVFAGLTLWSFKPLPKANPSNCAAVKGRVVKVDSVAGARDIVITLSGDDAYYYINRGVEAGIKLDEISGHLINNNVTLYYIRHWSFLNINSKTRHIARIEVNGTVVYNEWTAISE